MADLKISQLPSATTPLAGTEVLPIVQSGTTKKATIANIVGAGTSAGSFTGVTSTAPVGVVSQTSAGSSGYVQLSGTANYRVFGGPFIGGTVVEAAAGGVYTKVAGAITTATTSNGLEVSTGNLVIGTSGKGIDFSATASGSGTMTSELLADYEEGTWTPNQGSGLTVVGAFTSSGTYTKVGRLVTVRGTMAGATSIAVGAIGYITDNLPFVAPNATIALVGSSWTGTSAALILSANLVSVSAISASSGLYFSCTYEV